MFDNLNHLNEIFILLSLLEQSTLVLRNSLLFSKPAPQEEDLPRMRPGTPPPPQLRPVEGLWEHPSKQEGTGAPMSDSSQGNRGPQETGQEQSI